MRGDVVITERASGARLVLLLPRLRLGLGPIPLLPLQVLGDGQLQQGQILRFTQVLPSTVHGFINRVPL